MFLILSLLCWQRTVRSHSRLHPWGMGYHGKQVISFGGGFVFSFFPFSPSFSCVRFIGILYEFILSARVARVCSDARTAKPSKCIKYVFDPNPDAIKRQRCMSDPCVGLKWNGINLPHTHTKWFCVLCKSSEPIETTARDTKTTNDRDNGWSVGPFFALSLARSLGRQCSLSSTTSIEKESLCDFLYCFRFNSEKF